MARYSSARTRPQFTFDAELELKDAGLVAADAAATVDGSAAVVDLGTGRVDATVVLDVTALEIASGNETYTILVQGSSSATFASDIVILAALPIGDGSTIASQHGSSGVDVDDTTGRYEIPFTNVRNNINYRYIRLWTDVEGTIATGINYSAFVGLQN